MCMYVLCKCMMYMHVCGFTSVCSCACVCMCGACSFLCVFVCVCRYTYVKVNDCGPCWRISSITLHFTHSEVFQSNLELTDMVSLDSQIAQWAPVPTFKAWNYRQAVTLILHGGWSSKLWSSYLHVKCFNWLTTFSGLIYSFWTVFFSKALLKKQHTA